MTVVKRFPRSRPLTAALVVVLLTVLAGCEAVGPGDQSTGQEQEAAQNEAAEADSVTIVNEASETIFVVPLEKETGQLAYLGKDHPAAQPPSGPEDPRLLSPGEEVTIGFDEVFISGQADGAEFQRGDGLYVMLKAYYVFNERSGYSGVGALINTWEEMEENAFTVEFEDEDLDMKEDFWD